MGFGYNPDLWCGERLDMLEYFSWMSRLSGSILAWTVWDASSYYIVNKISLEKVRKLGSQPRAEKILDLVLEELERPKRREILQSCDLRKDYLGRLLRTSGIDGEYLDARDIFPTVEFAEALEMALQWFWRAREDMVSAVFPKGATCASELYLPLEIAECVYLIKRGIDAKYGPASEQAFDRCIIDTMDMIGSAYTTFRSPLGPCGKAGYLRGGGILTSDSPDMIRAKLKDQAYRGFIANYTLFLRAPEESLEDTCIRLVAEVSR
jgi:hypothetical protein